MSRGFAQNINILRETFLYPQQLCGSLNFHFRHYIVPHGINFALGRKNIFLPSVVTKDIHSNCVAAGNPCKVLREIDERDEIYYYKDRKFTDSGIDED